jgi:hypothetical protein
VAAGGGKEAEGRAANFLASSSSQRMKGHGQRHSSGKICQPVGDGIRGQWLARRAGAAGSPGRRGQRKREKTG